MNTPRPQLTTRDILCLVWIALQYAIRIDQLQRLLWRHTPAADRHKLKPGTTSLSLDRTYELIHKWLSLGLIEKDTILHKDKLWIWCSQQGLRTLVELGALPHRFNYGEGKPASGRLRHLYSVNEIRLAIEEKRPHDLWESEREIRREAPALVKGETRPHVPDALLTNATNGKVTALEIERSSKTEHELLDNLRELAVTYKSVSYFVTGATRRQIEAHLENFTAEMRKPFVIYDLKEYAHDYGI